MSQTPPLLRYICNKAKGGDSNGLLICRTKLYKTGYSVSANTLYTWAKNNFSYTGNYPKGTAIQTRDLINYHYGLSYSLTSRGLTSSEVWNLVFGYDQPIVAGMSYTANNTRYGHMVVICGAIMSGTDFYYYLMDPNVPSGYVLVYVGNSNSTHFTYASNTGTYTTWEVSIY